jgi:Trk-type K+ transport system membrane component
LVYIICTYAVAFVFLLIYFGASSDARQQVATAEAGGKNHNFAWWSLFHIVTAFNNAGMSLNTDNMIPFASDRCILLLLSVLILLGNTIYPLMLRVLVYIGMLQ